MSGSGIRCAICKSAPRSRQITMPVPHHSVFYRPVALPAAQPTASKHWRLLGSHTLRVNWYHCHAALMTWTPQKSCLSTFWCHHSVMWLSPAFSFCRHYLHNMWSWVCVTVGRLSVRLSHLVTTRHCYRFAAVGPAARRYRSIDAQLVVSSCAAARHAAANAESTTLSADVGSWLRTFFIAAVDFVAREQLLSAVV